MTYKEIAEANKSLVAVDVKGKSYVEVNQRVKAFRMIFPTGFIRTELISNNDGVCVIKAECGVGESVLSTGIAYEKENSTFINKTSYIENCETSAVGRALGFLGFGIDTSIASAEEVQTAMANQGVTKAQKEAFIEECQKKGLPYEAVLEDYGWKKGQAITPAQFGNAMNYAIRYGEKK